MNKGSNYIEDISQIRNIMERSSRFMSLSGVSGILAGVYALIGAYIAYKIFYFSDELIYKSISESMLSSNVFKLIILACVILILAIGTAIWFSYLKAKKNNHKIWDATARRMVVNLFIPLVTGGIFILILFSKGVIGLIAPVTLIFYGLALINASKYTYTDIRYLGFCEIALGLASSYFIGYGLVFWAIGFGVMHIVYGSIMYFKYEK
ncbi:hypothetical protein C900_00778 [Fulvivirga imtechensis AK7]|uniref:Brp/Blh family beta-carotene 15,15'-monooxygenase n=1 Tax=Fulvivirga imtechensis AK7 TaxID=1237149 RepID=L8K026_9BACT|nr:hypothetical protein [Fulvivirga imtechensis]ELR72817.1 hypothetical protein C900_00778 [Fulvivirga imtechensis AK7]